MNNENITAKFTFVLNLTRIKQK